MWGQASIYLVRLSFKRIIPTRVGTRGNSFRSAVRAEDHPHACGDKALFPPRLRQTQGSSPRVWGQVYNSVMRKIDERIIPTRVGTRSEFQSFRSHRQDHPHACGDKDTSLVYSLSSHGSSPRVWGQGCFRRYLCKNSRIIPTRVGTSAKVVCTSVQIRDHPHACGDKTKEIKENSGFAKSTA